MLLISDLHLGKIDHFRKWGIGLPPQAALDNFSRLQDLILSFPKTERIIFLGDLFHSDMNRDWDHFITFMNGFPAISFELVIGNHDVFDQGIYASSFEKVYPETITINQLVLSHEPMDCEEDFYNLCGHIHPGFILRGQGRQRLRLPCFHFGEKGGVLPAFGTFTGLYMMDQKQTDDIYVIAEEEVIKV